MTARPIFVDTFKYGGSPHYRFPVHLVTATPDHWIVRGEYGRICDHYTKGVSFAIENRSVEFYWPDRSYTIAADFHPDGTLHQYYCNVVLPPTLYADRVEWIDLDLDLLVAPDLTWRLVDEDEFAENAATFGYPKSVIASARKSVEELVALVQAQAYPFDGSAHRLFGSTKTGAP